MIYCADSFEVYQTDHLIQKESLNTNYGEHKRITGVRNSLSNTDSDSITYVDDRVVYRLFRNTDFPGEPVEKEAIIEFEGADLERPNQYGDFASDAFVFD